MGKEQENVALPLKRWSALKSGDVAAAGLDVFERRAKNSPGLTSDYGDVIRSSLGPLWIPIPTRPVK